MAWFEEYRKCGCVSPVENEHADLPGYCPTHGNDKVRAYRVRRVKVYRGRNGKLTTAKPRVAAAQDARDGRGGGK